jgi:hypothetical protein
MGIENREEAFEKLKLFIIVIKYPIANRECWASSRWDNVFFRALWCRILWLNWWFRCYWWIHSVVGMPC